MIKINRRHPISAGDAIREFLVSSGLSTGMNTHLISKLWDEVSGEGAATAGKYYRNGKLYVTINSSVIRSRLAARREILREQLNATLAYDPLFTGGREAIKEIILK